MGIPFPHSLGYHTFSSCVVLAPIENSRSVSVATGTGKDRKIMARPKKEKELKRNHHIMLRLNDTEYEIVSEAAKATHLTVAAYVRKQLMNKRVDVKYEIVADVPELKKLIAEFGKIGSNLNQIARHFNQGGIHSQEMRREINQCIAVIYEMKYEVIKMAGDFHGNTETHNK